MSLKKISCKSLELKIVPPLQLIIAGLLMLLIANILPYCNVNLAYKNITATLLGFIAVSLSIFAIVHFKRHKTTIHPHQPEKTSTIVNTGIYARSRNPMYLALILILLAFAIFLANIATLIIIPCFIAYITQFQIKPEERILTQLFGQEYLTYTQKVRRWL